jgi:hypothetical protein
MSKLRFASYGEVQHIREVSPFTDADEFFLCAERAIQKQISPGYPAMIDRKQMELHDTKEVYFTEEPQSIAGRNFQVIAELYPANVHQSSHRPTMEKTWS